MNGSAIVVCPGLTTPMGKAIDAFETVIRVGRVNTFMDKKEIGGERTDIWALRQNVKYEEKNKQHIPDVKEIWNFRTSGKMYGTFGETLEKKLDEYIPRQGLIALAWAIECGMFIFPIYLCGMTFNNDITIPHYYYSEGNDPVKISLNQAPHSFEREQKLVDQWIEQGKVKILNAEE